MFLLHCTSYFYLFVLSGTSTNQKHRPFTQNVVFLPQKFMSIIYANIFKTKNPSYPLFITPPPPPPPPKKKAFLSPIPTNLVEKWKLWRLFELDAGWALQCTSLTFWFNMLCNCDLLMVSTGYTSNPFNKSPK